MPSKSKTEAEKRALEPSACTRTPKRGHEKDPMPRFTEGMNLRYEQDPVTRGPTGHQLAEGFAMMDDDFDGEL